MLIQRVPSAAVRTSATPSARRGDRGKPTRPTSGQRRNTEDPIGFAALKAAPGVNLGQG